MRTTLVKIAMIVMLPLWSGFGCKKAHEPSHGITPGEEWLNMSVEERTQAAGGFIDGYNMGVYQACGLLYGKFQINHNKELLEEEKLSNMDDVGLCKQKAGTYSRIDHHADTVEKKISTYVDLMTSFYQRYPSERYVPPFLLLVNMQDGFDSTVEQLHDSASKSILRHH